MKKFSRIYLIDDDITFNFITKLLLNRIAFADEIIDYCDATIAMSDLKKEVSNGRSHLPDLIFLDLNMPGMDGWDFLDQYKELPDFFVTDCKLYILTSSIDPTDKYRSRSYSCVTDFITKPLRFSNAQSIQKTIEGIQ